MIALFFVLFFGTMLVLGMPLFASIVITTFSLPLIFGDACGYALMNVNEAFGMKAFVHGGKEPYIRLTVKPSEKLKDTVKLLQILADNMKSSECAAKSNL